MATDSLLLSPGAERFEKCTHDYSSVALPSSPCSQSNLPLVQSIPTTGLFPSAISIEDLSATTMYTIAVRFFNHSLAFAKKRRLPLALAWLNFILIAFHYSTYSTPTPYYCILRLRRGLVRRTVQVRYMDCTGLQNIPVVVLQGHLRCVRYVVCC